MSTLNPGFQGILEQLLATRKRKQEMFNPDDGTVSRPQMPNIAQPQQPQEQGTGDAISSAIGQAVSGAIAGKRMGAAQSAGGGEGIGDMGARMQGMPGAEGNKEMSAGQLISMLVAAGIEGGAAGYQGRAPQSPQIIAQGLAYRGQQDIANRKIAMDEEEFGLKKETLGLQKQEKEQAMDLRARIRQAAEALTDPNNKDTTRGIGSLAALMAESGDSAAAISAMKLIADEKSRGNLTSFLGQFTGKQPKLEDITQAALATGDKGIIEWADKSLPLLKSAYGEEKEKSFNENDVTAFVASQGKLRGPTIPQGFTVDQGKAFLDEKRKIATQNISLRQEGLDIGRQREDRMERQRQTILPSQQNQITTSRVQYKALSDYEKAYDEFIAGTKGGAVSDIFRGAIAKNRTAQKLSDVVMPEGRTEPERKLAAKYTALVSDLRYLTNEVGVLTDVDAMRILGALDPSGERKQVKANIEERKVGVKRTFDTLIQDLAAMDKDVSKFKLFDREEPQAQTGTTV